MKIVMWADVHCEHSVHGNNSRGEVSTSLTIDWLVDHALKEKADCVFVLGDLFDDHGLIESSLAVEVRNRLLALTAAGIKIVFVTGNHEYQEVSDRFFGRGLVEAIFGGRESQGIYVVDAKARIIDLGPVALVGIPYRATDLQFTETVITPLKDDIKSYELSKKKMVIGWHCGVPLSAAWRGDEPENAFINIDNPEMRFLFDLAYNNRIFCGHYHGPADTKFGKLGTFTYVGSPSTRTIAESDQIKRVLVWEDGEIREVSTGLILDYIAESPEDAQRHVKDMRRVHGDNVEQILKVRIRLPSGSSMDDYNLAKKRLQDLGIGGQINIDRPEIRSVGLADNLIAKGKTDSSYTQTMMERDVLLLAIMTSFAPRGTKPPSLEAIQALIHTPDSELNDARIASILFERSDSDPHLKELGTVGRMLIYAVKMSAGAIA